MTTTCQIDLPFNYRPADVIGYHLRDTEQISEQYRNGILHKGLIWQGQPACLQLAFRQQRLHAQLTGPEHINRDDLVALVHRMAGLDQDIDRFEQEVSGHVLLGPLVSQQSGLRVPVAATPFEALVWAIIGQQISVQAAISIRRRFIRTAGYPLDTGLWCHPDAQTVATVPFDVLRTTGLSTAKTHALHAISQAIIQGRLTLDGDLSTQSPESIRDQLLAIRGIGPWTADYTLLRGYGWLDGSLHGDVAVRRGLRTLLQQEDPVSQNDAREWLTPFTPWRALVAAHLWASQKLQA